MLELLADVVAMKDPVLPRIFEAVMVVCFGVSWPVSIVKMLREKRVEGKSPLFLFLIFFGYVCAVIWKSLLAGYRNEPLQWVTLFYIVNGTLVAIDLMVYYHYARQARLAEPTP